MSDEKTQERPQLNELGSVAFPLVDAARGELVGRGLQPPGLELASFPKTYIGREAAQADLERMKRQYRADESVKLVMLSRGRNFREYCIRTPDGTLMEDGSLAWLKEW